MNQKLVAKEVAEEYNKSSEKVVFSTAWNGDGCTTWLGGPVAVKDLYKRCAKRVCVQMRAWTCPATSDYDFSSPPGPIFEFYDDVLRTYAVFLRFLYEIIGVDTWSTFSECQPSDMITTYTRYYTENEETLVDGVDGFLKLVNSESVNSWVDALLSRPDIDNIGPDISVAFGLMGLRGATFKCSTHVWGPTDQAICGKRWSVEDLVQSLRINEVTKADYTKRLWTSNWHYNLIVSSFALIGRVVEQMTGGDDFRNIIRSIVQWGNETVMNYPDYQPGDAETFTENAERACVLALYRLTGVRLSRGCVDSVVKKSTIDVQKFATPSLNSRIKRHVHNFDNNPVKKARTTPPLRIDGDQLREWMERALTQIYRDQQQCGLFVDVPYADFETSVVAESNTGVVNNGEDAKRVIYSAKAHEWFREKRQGESGPYIHYTANGDVISTVGSQAVFNTVWGDTVAAVNQRESKQTKVLQLLDEIRAYVRDRGSTTFTVRDLKAYMGHAKTNRLLSHGHHHSLYALKNKGIVAYDNSRKTYQLP